MWHYISMCIRIKKVFYGLSTLYELLISHQSSGVLIDFSPTVKAATLILISGHGSAISSAKEGKSGFIIIW